MNFPNGTTTSAGSAYRRDVDKQPSTTAPLPPASVQPDGGDLTVGDPTLSDVALTATIVAGLLDAAPDGLLLVDASGRLLLVNSRIEEMFGYTRSDLLGQPVEVLLPEHLRAGHVAHRDDFAHDPRVRPMGVGLALRGRRQDGSELPVEVSLSPLATGEGQWTVAAIRDDSQRQQIEQQRREDAVADEQGRIAEDLAETVIRGLFGTGLMLQGLLDRPVDEVRTGLVDAIESIDGTIRDVRSAIFGLRPGQEL